MAEAKSTCVVASCDRPIHNKALGYCAPHYKRHWRHGDVQENVPVPSFRKTPQPVNDRDGNRECQQCKLWAPLSSYHRDPSSPLGRKTTCATCRRAAERTRHHRNREANNARNRAYRVAHLYELRAKEAKAYADNRAARIAKATAQVHLRRARLAATPNDSGVTILALRNRDGDLCHYCGVTMVFASFKRGERPDNMATLEHLVPVSKGGSHSWSNCVAACWRCNISKSDRLPNEYANERASQGGARP